MIDGTSPPHGRLSKVRSRLDGGFGSSFLPIPHWLSPTVSPCWVADESFFGHPWTFVKDKPVFLMRQIVLPYR